MKTFRLLVAAALFSGQVQSALAGAGTITTQDAGGVTRTFVIVTNGGGNFLASTVLCDGVAGANCATVSGGAVKVDGSAATQPVSGTVTANAGTGNFTVVNGGTFATQAAQSGTWNITNVSGTVSLPTGASTSAKQPALGTAGTASADVITVQGIASMTPFLSNPGTAANWGVGTSTQNSATVANGQLALAQFNTTPTTITTGNMSPLQMDSAGNLLVNIKTGASSGAVAQGSTTSGQTGLLVQCAVTTSAPTYTTAQTNPLSCDTAGNTRVTVTNATPGIANNADTIAAVAASSTSPVPVNNYGYVFNGTTFDRMRSATQTGSVAVGSADPCLGANKTNLAINQNGTSSVQLVGLSGSTVIYVCSLSLVAAGATTVALTTGTGSACVTGNAAVIGTTTASIANSISLASNGGMTYGNGIGTVAKGAASSELCMILGTNVFVSGNLTYVQQ